MGVTSTCVHRVVCDAVVSGSFYGRSETRDQSGEADEVVHASATVESRAALEVVGLALRPSIDGSVNAWLTQHGRVQGPLDGLGNVLPDLFRDAADQIEARRRDELKAGA